MRIGDWSSGGALPICEGAQEERLFAPGADLSERARGTDEAVILEFGLFGRGDMKGRGRRRPGLRLAEAFERELAVELVVMLRSVREIAVGEIGRAHV